MPGEVVLDAPTVAEEGFALGTPVASAVAVGGPPVHPGRHGGRGRHRPGRRRPFIGLVGPDALAVAGEEGYGRIMVAARRAPAVGQLAAVAAVAAPKHSEGRQQILDGAVEDAVRDVDSSACCC